MNGLQWTVTVIALGAADTVAARNQATVVDKRSMQRVLISISISVALVQRALLGRLELLGMVGEQAAVAF